MEKFTREFIENNRVTVMCDYHCDGLWIDDGPVNIKMVAEAYDIPLEGVVKLAYKIDNWQKLYELLDLNSEKIIQETYSTKDFKNFIDMGKEIAVELRDILPSDVDVHYVDEETSKIYAVNFDHDFMFVKNYERD